MLSIADLDSEGATRSHGCHWELAASHLTQRWAEPTAVQAPACFYIQEPKKKTYLLDLSVTRLSCSMWCILLNAYLNLERYVLLLYCYYLHCREKTYEPQRVLTPFQGHRVGSWQNYPIRSIWGLFCISFCLPVRCHLWDMKTNSSLGSGTIISKLGIFVLPKYWGEETH